MAQPVPGTSRALPPGKLHTSYGGTAIVAYLPSSAATADRIPLWVFLHGALRTVDYFVDGFRPLADATGVMIAAPFAYGGTWDAIEAEFGPDVRGLNHTLSWAHSVAPIDARRTVLAGFSDGASYALSLGRANGDIFSRLVAFSPGFALNVPEIGRPSIGVSHGTEDEVLPYSYTRDETVPWLRARGYDVELVSFAGGHAVLLPYAQQEFERLGAVPSGAATRPPAR